MATIGEMGARHAVRAIPGIRGLQIRLFSQQKIKTTECAANIAVHVCPEGEVRRLVVGEG
jgi:hypothetical protein